MIDDENYYAEVDAALRRWISIVVAAALAAVVLFWAVSGHAQTPVQPSAEEQARIRTWIETRCCVTSQALPAGTGCCFKIAPSEVTHISGWKFRINATGQEVDAQPSKDGSWWRCACDEIPGGGWLVHATADTRCLFISVGF